MAPNCFAVRTCPCKVVAHDLLVHAGHNAGPVPFCDGEAEESEDEAVSSDEDEDDDGEEMTVEEVCTALICLLPDDMIHFCAPSVGATSTRCVVFFSNCQHNFAVHASHHRYGTF
jgi:hypothetical protein